MTKPITSFRGKNEFLSNMYPCYISYEGKIYPSVEHAFQAAKTLDPEERILFQICETYRIKQLGKSVELRSDWETVKVSVMKELIKTKFSDPILAKKLVDTGDAELVEGNTWGDTFWGVCKSKGENHLGKLLMEVREEIR